MFAPFATHENAGRGFQCQLIDAQASELGDPKSCGRGQVQHGTIANPVPPPRVRCIEQRLHLFCVEETNQLGIGLLDGYAKDSTDLLQSRRQSVFEEVEERPDGGQADVARADGVAAMGLQMLEEARDQRRIDLLEAQL